MRKGPTHLNGSTLVEVLTSLSILALVFTLGMNIFQRLSGIHSPVEKAKTQSLIREVLYAPLPPLIAPKTETEIGGRVLVKTITPINEKQGLYEIEVSAYWQENLLDSRKRIIQIPLE